MIEKADPANDIDWEVFRLGEVDGRVMLRFADMQCDFVTDSGVEISCLKS